MGISSLYEIPAFSPLEHVAAACGVELRLFGSTATRVALCDQSDEDLNSKTLFDLAGFASDIDLSHCGPASLAPEIRSQILKYVPFAPWFRWSIIGGKEQEALDEQSQFNATIPLRRITISSHYAGGIADPSGALEEAGRQKVSFKRNAMFMHSPRAKRYFDTEASGVLLFMDAALDFLEYQKIDPISRSPKVTGIEEALKSTIEFFDGDSTAHQRNLALRRLWYRLAATALRAGPDQLKTWLSLLKLDELESKVLTAAFGDAITRLSEENPNSPIIVSSAIADEEFRVPLNHRFGITFGGEAEAVLDEILSALTTSADSLPFKSGFLANSNKKFALCGDIKLLAAIHDVQSKAGKPLCATNPSLWMDDFVHIGIDIPENVANATNMDPKKMGAIVVGRRQSNSKSDTFVVPAFAMVSKSIGGNNRRLTIRLNFGRSCCARTMTISVFLVSWDQFNE
jgi:hypothetical protein